MTDPAEEKAQDGYATEKASEAATNAVVDIPDEVDPDDSKVHLINANGGAGGDVDPLAVKIADGTTSSSEAEGTFNGLGKDEVMKYADEPFWKRLRLILFVLFWVGWFAMLVTAVIIIVLAPRCPPRPDLKWYQTDVVYQVLPESFKDSNGDGKGDFKGLKDKSDYIFDDLGAKAIWLSSIYETDGLDSGLGIINHKAVAPWFNATVSDIRSWMKNLRKDEKRVIMDLIPNQTSKKHEWFMKSQKKEGKFTDYYVWAAPNSNGGPPNNWESVYGGSAWELDPVRNEYYLHQFSKDHPDLNLQNPDVLEEIKEIMRFWLGAGVSGFNVRGVEHLTENKDMTDNTNANSSQTVNYMGNLGVLEELRKVVDEFSDKPGRERVLFATLENPTKEVVEALWGPSDARRLHIVVAVMGSLNKNVKSTDIKHWVEEVLSDDRKQWLGSALSSAFVSRIASRMAGPKQLTVAHALQMLLPGTPFNYYGDEYGQKDGNVPADKTIDKHGRDNFRTPMQWTSGTNAGFTSGTPYLPIGADYKLNHVDAFTAAYSEDTPLKHFMELGELRKEESFQFGKTKVCAPDDELLLITREAERFPSFLTMINLGSTMKSFKLSSFDCVTAKETGTTFFHSRGIELDEDIEFGEMAVMLEPGDVVVVRFSA